MGPVTIASISEGRSPDSWQSFDERQLNNSRMVVMRRWNFPAILLLTHSYMYFKQITTIYN